MSDVSSPQTADQRQPIQQEPRPCSDDAENNSHPTASTMETESANSEQLPPSMDPVKIIKTVLLPTFIEKKILKLFPWIL